MKMWNWWKSEELTKDQRALRRRGDRALREGRLQCAVRKFKRAGDKPRLIRAGRRCLKLNKLEFAWSAFRSANYAPGLVALGKVQLKRGNIQAARESFMAAEHKPSLVKLGKLLLKEGSRHEAIEVFVTARYRAGLLPLIEGLKLREDRAGLHDLGWRCLNRELIDLAFDAFDVTDNREGLVAVGDFYLAERQAHPAIHAYLSANYPLGMRRLAVEFLFGGSAESAAILLRAASEMEQAQANRQRSATKVS